MISQAVPFTWAITSSTKLSAFFSMPEIVSNRFLGGAAELSQRAKMAESGRRILQWIADSEFKTAIDPILFQSEARPFGAHAEAWIAAYRLTPEGRSFAGVVPSLRRSLGVRAAAAA